MGRLIDVDLLKENIIKCLKPLEPEEMIDVDVALLSVLMEIDKQSTAFDVNEVVRQLESRKTRAAALQEENTSEYFEGETDAFEIAIEIVKGGGN